MKLLNNARCLYHTIMWCWYRQNWHKGCMDLKTNGGLIYHCGCIAHIMKCDSGRIVRALNKGWKEYHHN